MSQPQSELTVQRYSTDRWLWQIDNQNYCCHNGQNKIS